MSDNKLITYGEAVSLLSTGNNVDTNINSSEYTLSQTEAPYFKGISKISNHYVNSSAYGTLEFPYNYGAPYICSDGSFSTPRTIRFSPYTTAYSTELFLTAENIKKLYNGLMISGYNIQWAPISTTGSEKLELLVGYAFPIRKVGNYVFYNSFYNRWNKPWALQTYTTSYIENSSYRGIVYNYFRCTMNELKEASTSSGILNFWLKYGLDGNISLNDLENKIYQYGSSTYSLQKINSMYNASILTSKGCLWDSSLPYIEMTEVYPLSAAEDESIEQKPVKVYVHHYWIEEEKEVLDASGNVVLDVCTGEPIKELVSIEKVEEFYDE